MILIIKSRSDQSGAMQFGSDGGQLGFLVGHRPGRRPPFPRDNGCQGAGTAWTGQRGGDGGLHGWGVVTVKVSSWREGNRG
jgi:hypothetical protein